MADIRRANMSTDDLKKIIAYDPSSGRLTWKTRPASFFSSAGHSQEHSAAKWNARYAGREALTAVEVHGYGHGDIDGKRYKAHRVAWALYYGFWPECDIDHINGDPSDNRISNLRTVSKSDNARNQKRSTANKSGTTGVCWNPLRNKWSAQIKMNGRKLHIGLYENIQDAVDARKAAEKRFNFHPNHGRFAA